MNSEIKRYLLDLVFISGYTLIFLSIPVALFHKKPKYSFIGIVGAVLILLSIGLSR